MVQSAFADLPPPPYYVVTFSSQRPAGGSDDGYNAAAERMADLAAQQPGYLGAESTRGADGFGITLSYWASLEAIAGWKANAEHAAAREQGRKAWYLRFELRIAKVERAYGGPVKSG